MPANGTIKENQLSRLVYEWEALGDGVSGNAANFLQTQVFPIEMSVQVQGTFGGGTVAIEGSIDGVSFYPLTDANGTAIEFTANGLKQIPGTHAYVRPTISGSTGADIDMFLLAVG